MSAAKPVGNKQDTPAPVTPNASLTTGQKNALNALQTARSNFEAANVGVYLYEVNVLLAAIDDALAACV